MTMPRKIDLEELDKSIEDIKMERVRHRSEVLLWIKDHKGSEKTEPVAHYLKWLKKEEELDDLETETQIDC
jgi:hypothetical protein